MRRISRLWRRSDADAPAGAITSRTGSRSLGPPFRCALVAAAGALLVSVGAAPASATTVAGVQPVPGTTRLNDVACSTASRCVAVGGVTGGAVGVTITDGVAGAAQPITDVFELRGVDCPSATTCVAVGSRQAPPIPPSNRPSSQGYVVSITNGVLGTPLSVPGVRNLVDVACASATTCYALGSITGGITVVVTITNGVAGAITPVQPDPADPYGLEHIACASATTCYAVGESSEQGVLVPVVEGVPGAPQRLPGSVLMTGVACSSATTCFAVGLGDDFFSSVLVPITDGVAGPAISSEIGLGSIACSSSSSCEALGATLDGTAVVVPIVNGVLGEPVALPGAGYSAIACASQASCVVVGEDNPNHVGVFLVVYLSPADAQACKDGGWRSFRAPAFKNQGACVSSVNAGPKSSR